MAKPRIFVSSTFYDLRQVRSDIEAFLNSIGYEPIIFERGSVPYNHELPLDISAYSEVDRCDVLVSIIGGRYGSTSSLDENSISSHEVRRAIEANLPVFFFVGRDVLAEYKTWEKNKEKTHIDYAHVDDVKIFKFLQEIYSLKRNNPIFGFSLATDISSILRDQFAGLFQSMLRIRGTAPVVEMMSQLKGLAENLDNIVQTLGNSDVDRKDAIEQIIITNHPIFDHLKQLTNTPYRVFFTDIRELDAWLKVRGWKRYHDLEDVVGDAFTWVTTDKTKKKFNLLINKSLFDEKEN